MSCPGLDPDLAAALQVLEYGLGPLQVLDVRPSPPRRPACPPAPAAAGSEPVQPSLFDPTPDPHPDVYHRPVHPPSAEPPLARGPARPAPVPNLATTRRNSQ
jgi:hypothetical protein